MTNSRLPAVFLAVLALSVASGAQSPGQQSAQPAPATQKPPAQPQEPPIRPDQQPTFRTGINFVRVDVIVSDKKGTPLADLKMTDFEVTEDGKPQTIEQFKFVKLDGGNNPGDAPPTQIRSRFEEETEAARDDVRMFIIFFDDYHVRLGSSLAVKGPLTKFIQQSLGPSDLVAIMYPLTPLDGIALTRNHNSIISAINKFEGRKFRYDPRNEFEEKYAQYPTEIVEQIRNQVTMTAMRGLATRLGALREGRKAIIFVSEGFVTMLPPQMRNPIATMPGMGNPRARDPFAGVNDSREETAQFMASVDLLSQMRDVYDAANRNNAAIYALDPRGLAVNEFDINEGINRQTDAKALQATQDTLRVLAEETDGRAIVNRNDLAKGLEQVVRDSSAYYLIGYNSSQAPSDGKFHEIKVRVKKPGVDVRARKGYWAPTVDDTARAIAGPRPEAPKPVQQALASLAAPGGRSGGRYVRTWIGTSRAANGKTQVTFVWDIALAAADATASARSLGAPPASGPQRVVFDAPPGKLELRISVEGAGGAGVLDTEIRDLVIPDLTTPDPALSTPRVFRARTAREFQMVTRDADAVPVATREFSRTDRLLLRFDVYGSEPATAALLNRNGQKMAEIPIAAATTGGTHQIDFALAAVAPGEYLVEVSVKGSEQKELIPIKVVS
jgi:VWFA-related protein